MPASSATRVVRARWAGLRLHSVLTELELIPSTQLYGRVAAVQGLLLEVAGAERALSVGSRCRIQGRGGAELSAEVVGFRNNRALMMPFGGLDGVGVGCKALVAEQQPVVYPSAAWLGRVVNAMGEPIDGGPPLPNGPLPYAVRGQPPKAHERGRVAG